MSRIRKISGPSLTRNAMVIPHVTNHDDADITELEAFRVQLNKENEKNKDAPKLTMLAFLVKACVAALKKYPGVQRVDRPGNRRRRVPEEVLPHRFRGRHAERPRRSR